MRKPGKPPKYQQDVEARRRSREAVGTVPGTKVIQDKRRKKPKHKTFDYSDRGPVGD